MTSRLIIAILLFWFYIINSVCIKCCISTGGKSMSEYYLGNMTFDISGSVKDYEYTKRSIVNYNRMIESGQFESMSSDAIFRYLTRQMELVSFGDYLKRYIYEGTGMTVPFCEVPEITYIDFISESFAMNRAPHAFEPVKTRWSSIIKRWLRSDSVKRSTVFLLGFGLNMTDQDVSEFLMKVLKEQDFRFEIPEEAVFWHCFHHGLPYSKAVELLEYYKDTEPGDASLPDPEFWENVRNVLPLYLSNENKLRQYLIFLKSEAPAYGDIVFEVFNKLYERALYAAAQVMQEKNKQVSAYDIENVLYGGIRKNESKNLPPVSKSVLSGYFYKMRLSRQRISRLVRREAEVSRFDIFTLLFLVYAVTVDPEWPESRCSRFVDEANEILGSCRMMGIYPVNPYECFVLMCLLTEDPLGVYNDVWEMSYDAEEM